MGIHGILKEIGPGTRISLAKLSSAHYRTHARPLRLAIDISIWLFQIQSGKGGSNPALRTFYYRLLRLVSLNIFPLFVFDGPNKPLFKRNRKVGGPGVRVATVPEFLAKQLLKQFGFPWHVAPGEAEAECALLEVEGVVDAVLSDDVDTLMFGSRVTVRNWTPEGSTKTPTHVNLYKAEETKNACGLDREGMVLVALMSGGDYIPEGIPGCGPKLACDAARAGFGKDLCALRKSDKAGLASWRGRLQHEIRTNESKLFSRKNKSLAIPDDFPSQEVLGYYTHPCVSSQAKLEQLRSTLKWDQPIDFPALRSFAQDAFDWRCLGGAKKFIRNLAPAMLIRRLRLISEELVHQSQEAQEAAEAELVCAIHGVRTHYSTDHESEMRISFVPSNLVPIDLSIEDEEDDFLPAGGLGDSDDDEALPPSTATPADSEADVEEAAASPTRKRQARPYDPEAQEKLWILKDFLQLGCPLLLEAYEAAQRDPKALFRQKRAARAAAGKKGTANIHTTTGAKRGGVGKAKGGQDGDAGGQENALLRHLRVTKATGDSVENDESGKAREGSVLSDVAASKMNSRHTASSRFRTNDKNTNNDDSISAFKLPSTQVPTALFQRKSATVSLPAVPPAAKSSSTAGFFAPFASQRPDPNRASTEEIQRTPNRRKRRSAELSTPRRLQGRAAITGYFSPTPRKHKEKAKGRVEVVELLSSSPVPVFALGALLDGTSDDAEGAGRRDSGRLRRSTSLVQPSDSCDDSRDDVLASTELHDVAPLTARKISDAMDIGLDKDEHDVFPALPATVTKRRRKGPLRRSISAPAADCHSTSPLFMPTDAASENDDEGELMDLSAFSSLPRRASWEGNAVGEGGFLRDNAESERGKEVSGFSSSLPTPPAEDEDHADSALARQTTKTTSDPRIEMSDAREVDSSDDLPAFPVPRQRRSPRLSSRTNGPLVRPAPASTTTTATSSRAKSKNATVRKPGPERAGSATIATGTAATMQKATVKQPRQPPRSKIVLRESLAGAWKEVAVEEMDLTGDSPGTVRARNEKPCVEKVGRGGREWRKSGVEVLDLTGV